MGARQKPLFAPGTAWAYSDSNYIALGLILQKVSHRSVRQLVQERISEPGLRHTYLGSGSGFRGTPYAHGYSVPSYYAAGPVVDGLVDTTGLDLNWTWTAGRLVHGDFGSNNLLVPGGWPKGRRSGATATRDRRWVQGWTPRPPWRRPERRTDKGQAERDKAVPMAGIARSPS